MISKLVLLADYWDWVGSNFAMVFWLNENASARWPNVSDDTYTHTLFFFRFYFAQTKKNKLNDCERVSQNVKCVDLVSIQFPGAELWNKHAHLCTFTQIQNRPKEREKKTVHTNRMMPVFGWSPLYFAVVIGDVFVLRVSSQNCFRFSSALVGPLSSIELNSVCFFIRMGEKMVQFRLVRAEKGRNRCGKKLVSMTKCFWLKSESTNTMII